jgi:hypothetical protein
MPADVYLAIDKFQFDNHATQDDMILEIEGRQKGIVGWIMAQVGLNTRSFLTITRRELTFRFANLGGITLIVAPLDAITCAICGVKKPVGVLAFGTFSLLAGIVMFGLAEQYELGFLGIVIGLLCIGYFHITQHLILTFSTGDIGGSRGLGFTSTTLAGEKISFEKLREVIEYLNFHIVDVQSSDIPLPPPRIKKIPEIIERKPSPPVPTIDKDGFITPPIIES